MKVTRRQFVKGGVAAFTVTFAAPELLCDLARAQGARSRNLVVLYLSGGNDALSMLIPYNDPFYYSRRPTIAVPAGNVLQIGTDSSRVALGLHPRLTGLETDLRSGPAGDRFSAPATRIRRVRISSAPTSGRRPTPHNSTGAGWVGRYLDSLPSPVDALVGWNTTRDLPRVLQSNTVRGAGDSQSGDVRVCEPERRAPKRPPSATRPSASTPTCRWTGPSWRLSTSSAQAAMGTLDRVATVASYNGTRDLSEQRLRARR